MIIFDLKCKNDHVFEAWFGSSSDFAEQKKKRLLQCPICGDERIEKAPMAANIGAKANRSAAKDVAVLSEEGKGVEMKQALAKLADMQSKLLKDSKWVGRDFDKEARAMDAGEIDRATIHGEVSKAEAKALVEDGINVMPLPLPVIPPAKRN